GGFEPGLEHEVALLHELRLDFEPVRRHCGLEAAQTLTARNVIRVTDDESDAPMTEPDQVLRHLAGRALVIHVGVRRLVLELVGCDAHERDGASIERLDELDRFAERRRDDEAIQVCLIDEPEHIALQLVASADDLMAQELKAAFAAPRASAVQHVDEDRKSTRLNSSHVKIS